MMNNKVKRFIGSLMFNIMETIIIFFSGRLLDVSSNYIILVMIGFFFIRMLCGNAKHYNKWYRCMLWSLLVFLSLYSLSDLNIFVVIILTAFTAYVTSGKADIGDMYMWKNNDEPSKYQDIVDFIKYHPLDDSIYEFEQKLKRQDDVLYLVYKYRFIDNLTFKEIGERLDLSNPRIAEMLDKIAFAMRINCKI